MELPDGHGSVTLIWKAKGLLVDMSLHYKGKPANMFTTGGLTRNKYGRDENLKVVRVASWGDCKVIDLNGACFGGMQGYGKVKDGDVISKSFNLAHWVDKPLPSRPAFLFCTLTVSFAEPHFASPVPLIFAIKGNEVAPHPQAK